MRKLFLLSILIIALAAPAYSQEVKLDFRASGFFSATSYLWRWNYSDNLFSSTGVMNVVPDTLRPPDATSIATGKGGEWNKTGSYVESRGRLKFDAIMG